MAQELKPESDELASDRKLDHIRMALDADMQGAQSDARFSYEPMLSGHLKPGLDLSCRVANKSMKYPLWVSSMTGGTEKAKTINNNLARLAGEYGLGMGLGSCRQLLYEDKRLEEFNIRSLMPDSPLFINLGIAQIEELIEKKELSRIETLIGQLDADGLIIHINPLQEWLQPEGDRIILPPISTVTNILASVNYPIMVKEVGQGFGRESLEALLQLPLEAMDLAGFGGTNFSKLELFRSDKFRHDRFKSVLNLGHCCTEMSRYISDFLAQQSNKVACKKIIFSGGIKGFLDGYYFTQSCALPSLYAHASAFLKYALDYDDLKSFLELELEGLKMAHALLKVKT